MIDQELLIERLSSARGLLQSYFEPPRCRWGGRYHDAERDCQECGDKPACEWIFAMAPAPDLSAFTHQRLVDELLFSTGYLDGRVRELGHDPGRCSCATCGWVRETMTILGNT